MNNLRTLMMLEYGDFPELDGRKPIDEFEHPRQSIYNSNVNKEKTL